VSVLCLRLSLSVNLVIEHLIILCHLGKIRSFSSFTSFHVISCVIGLFRPAFDKVWRGGAGRAEGVKYVFLSPGFAVTPKAYRAIHTSLFFYLAWSVLVLMESGIKFMTTALL
jgi:hypothetical protein